VVVAVSHNILLAVVVAVHVRHSVAAETDLQL
jgi:hypothetical protein